MPTDPSIITAIAAAVEAGPDNGPLRLHLATLLLDADRPAEALAVLLNIFRKLRRADRDEETDRQGKAARQHVRPRPWQLWTETNAARLVAVAVPPSGRPSVKVSGPRRPADPRV